MSRRCHAFSESHGSTDSNAGEPTPAQLAAIHYCHRPLTEMIAPNTGRDCELARLESAAQWIPISWSEIGTGCKLISPSPRRQRFNRPIRRSIPDHSPTGAPAADRRSGRPLLRLGHQPGRSRALLCGGGAEHGHQLAQLLLRFLRSGGDGHPGQAARCVLDPGAVRPDLRLPHLGHRPAPGHRRRPERPRSSTGP